jgi:hypothetical protein
VGPNGASPGLDRTTGQHKRKRATLRRLKIGSLPRRHRSPHTLGWAREEPYETRSNRMIIRSALEISPIVTNYGHMGRLLRCNNDVSAIFGLCRLPGHQRCWFPEPLALPN